MRLSLKRFATQDSINHVKAGTFGELFINGTSQGFTVEQPWEDNLRNKSCVPDGEYMLVPFKSPKFGDTFVMVNPALNVYGFEEECLSDTDRFLCLFVHRGSYPWNFQGCIGLGSKLNTNHQGQMWLANTRTTCEALITKLGDTQHTLTIASIGGAKPTK